MKVSYQRANPATGGGSYLLRFRDETAARTPRVLVDSGIGVDLDSLLTPGEYLAAILLTHAHLDHYATLADSLRDGASVYAAEPTANLLEDVLAEGEKRYGVGSPDGVLGALRPLDDWTQLIPDIEVRPIPAGHAPGAAAFVVRFRDGSETYRALFTGDFTARPVAGYLGLPGHLPLDVDALFVNVSTPDDFETTVTESLFGIVEQARAGSKVLATARIERGDRRGDRDPSSPVRRTGSRDRRRPRPGPRRGRGRRRDPASPPRRLRPPARRRSDRGPARRPGVVG